MTSISKQLILLFTLSITLLTITATYSQDADSLYITVDTTEITFEKILLDGKVSYRNKTTNEILNQSTYIQLYGSDMVEHDQTYDYWQSDRINPYRGVTLDTPFKIEFNQTTFTHPVDGEIVVTSRFGRRRRGPHRAIDIDLITGDHVRAVLPGKVRFVGYSSGHGKTVVIRHANEIETEYAHLSAYSVKENDIISEGQIIGLGGNTGNSRGSHLHLEVRYKGVCIHPEYVFNFDGSESIRGAGLWVTKGWRSPRMHSSYRKSEVTPLFSKDDAIAFELAEPRYHKVRKGDTLWRISRSYNLGLRELCKLNTISKKSILKIGQIIQVR